MGASPRVPTVKELVLGLRSRMYGSFDCRTDIIAIHPARFLFFAVPKVANSSMKRVLAQAIPNLPPSRQRKSFGRNNTTFSDRDIRRWMRSNTVLLCKHQVARFSDYRKVALVRNPWDRLVSCFVQKIGESSEDRSHREAAKPLAEAGLYHPQMSFRDFARAVCRIPDEKSNRHYRSQASFLVDKRGALLVHDILRFEALDEGFAHITELIGRDDLELPHLKRTDRRDYHEYYDDETAELVGRRYADDVRLFDYTY